MNKKNKSQRVDVAIYKKIVEQIGGQKIKIKPIDQDSSYINPLELPKTNS